MVALLPPEVFDLVHRKCPCRETQIRQLVTYYNNIFPSPPILVACGLEHLSKREVITNVFKAREIQHAVINSKECLSQRHLLSKIFAACLTALGHDGQIEQYEKTDSINALLGNLRKLFERAKGREFVAVIEDVDELKQPGPTLLPALGRLGNLVPGFSVLLTSNSPRPLNLRKTGVPYVHFPPYTRSEAVSIIISRMDSPLPYGLRRDKTVKVDETALLKLYPQFAITVYDSLISATSSTSIQTFQSACDRLWPRFIEPLVSAKEATGKEKAWHFARLLVLHRALFQSEGEGALHNTLTKRPLRDGYEPGSLSPPGSPIKRPPLLKHFSTLILLSAYLASHTQPKHDILLFSRMSSSSTSKKIRRLRQTPTKKKSASNPNATPTKDAATPTKSRTKSIFAANVNLGIARPFTLERLATILRAIHPHGIANRPGHAVSDRVYRELGELEKLRLVVRASGSGTSLAAGGTGDDATDEKWQVNVGRDWVVSIGQAWGMGVSEYEIEQDL